MLLRRLMGVLIHVFDAAAIGAGLCHTHGTTCLDIRQRHPDMIPRPPDRIRMPVRIIVNRAIIGEPAGAVDNRHGRGMAGGIQPADFSVGVQQDTAGRGVALGVQRFGLPAVDMPLKPRRRRDHLPRYHRQS